MQFELKEDQSMIQEMVRRFAQSEVAPGAFERDDAATFPRSLIEGLAELGLLGMLVPEEFSGAGLDLVSCAVAVEELARYDASLAMVVANHNAQVSSFIASVGSAEQRARWLPELATGESLGAWALEEGSGDSRPEAPHTLKTRAQRSGDWWTLSGRKTQVFQGGEAELFVVLARSAERPFGQVGLSAFLVSCDDEGVSMKTDTQRLGMRTAGVGRLSLDEVTLGDGHLLGRAGGALKYVEQAMAKGLVATAAVCVGIARACLEEARTYALERQQFKKTISNFQAIQWMLADMAMECDAARLLTLSAASAIDAGQVGMKAAAQAKLLASETAVRAGMKAVQVFGGNGFVREYSVERYLRDAKNLSVSAGSSDRWRGRIASNVLTER